MTWDLVAVIIIVALAAFYVFRRYFMGRSACAGCCGCNSLAAKQDGEEPACQNKERIRLRQNAG